MRKVLGTLTVLALASSMAAAVALAVPSPANALGAARSAARPVPVDDLPNPLETKRRKLREQAVSGVVNGQFATEVRNGSVVAKVGHTSGGGLASRMPRGSRSRDQYVELARDRTDRIFVILAEFGDQRHPSYPDHDTSPSTPGPDRFEGPLHNQIPRPDRAVDNTTIWQADYNRAHFQNMYFGRGESLRTYYESQSSGRYSVNGTVTDWVRVPYNEARYGRSDGFPCPGAICENTWELVRDAANTWVADQLAAGRTPADVAAEMKSFDQWDRYDYDGDGDFNESDGYIDHFQVVHSGRDQADGDSFYGEDAVWSHRWYAYTSDIGVTGPASNPIGGTQIGNTGIWIGDYTIQPENGGRNVFFHEYAHDLGLPDDYNIFSGIENNNQFWTLMGQPRLSAPTDGGIGERAGDLGAWNKLQLGWLDYETVRAGQNRTLTLGPSEYNSARPQSAIVVLPQKSVTTDLGPPFAGKKQFYSGNADNLDVTMTATADLTGRSTAALNLKARYAIEAGADHLYIEASADGATWTPLEGTVDGAAFGHDGAGRPAIDGSTRGAWVDLTVQLPAAFVGGHTSVRLHYVTDGGLAEGGFFGDDLTIVADGVPASTDGGEAASTWRLEGFRAVATTETGLYDNYYIAAHRSHVSYDRYLKTGPYSFGYILPNLVDHYAYQEGLLVSYWDTSFADNDTGTHPGGGRNLYVDAHPRPFLNVRGAPWGAGVQVYDAPFGLTRTDSLSLHVNGVVSNVDGQDAQPLFDDTQKFFYDELPNHGVKLPATGAKIRVLHVNAGSMRIRVETSGT